jgi:hypothetical protein
MNESPTVFAATGKLQFFLVPATGSYVIEACGAQGGPGGGPGGKGARIQGTFFLKHGEILRILVGVQGTAGVTPYQAAGGGGGGTFIWKGPSCAPLSHKPLIVAGGGGGGDGGDGLAGMAGGPGGTAGGRNGSGGRSDPGSFHYSGGGGAGWFSDGLMGSSPTFCGGGTLTHGGEAGHYCGNVGGTGGFGGGGGGAFLGHGSGGGGGYSGGGGGTQHGRGGGGGGSYNAGVLQTNTPGFQTGDGCVSIAMVVAPVYLSPIDAFELFGAASLRNVLGDPVNAMR